LSVMYGILASDLCANTTVREKEVNPYISGCCEAEVSVSEPLREDEVARGNSDTRGQNSP
jgi:hypothetical protein